MTEVNTLIVGAGISGLAAAAAIGKSDDFIILERDREIGGYCKTVICDGFTWDYSGHFFHFKWPGIEQWLRDRMIGQEVRTIAKRSFVSYHGARVDFPFQKNIHQLPRHEFIDCLVDLFLARSPNTEKLSETNFKEMLYSRYGRSISEKFLIPYNEKVYATDLATLDRDAMGRFFPHIDFNDVIQNMRSTDNSSYNSTFIYPAGGAIEYAKALASELAPQSLRLEEEVEHINLASKTAYTAKGFYRFNRLVSSMPFPALLVKCGIPHDAKVFMCNKVLVFNLGFDAKGPQDIHWLYVPDRNRCFYRVGFYDNIFDTPRMSLYVEIGFPMGARIEVEAERKRVLKDLRAEGIVNGQQLIAEHHVILSPAYVHITSQSIAEHARLTTELSKFGVYSIGRYGSWTYCSIEDNIVEARRLMTNLGLARAWPLDATA